MTLSELTARSLTLDELASRLTDHEDPIVRLFAERVIREIEDAKQPDVIE